MIEIRELALAELRRASGIDVTEDGLVVLEQHGPEIEERARSGGALRLYVSATPSESAVGFYASRGFRATPDPIPELLALEPEDIHMVLVL